VLKRVPSYKDRICCILLHINIAHNIACSPQYMGNVTLPAMYHVLTKVAYERGKM
jgi:hypothetical protein